MRKKNTVDRWQLTEENGWISMLYFMEERFFATKPQRQKGTQREYR
jgi:hypothetical protein